MKTTPLCRALAAPVAAVALLAFGALGQSPVVVNTSTTQYGTITTYTPGQTLVVAQETGSPLSYVVTGNTVFVDEAGLPVEAAHITSGVPITVSYVQDGDRMVASRVVVKKTVTPGGAVATQTTRTTTTTGAGTITEFRPGQTIVLRSSGATPITYATSGSTVYVDESGTPVAVENIAPGVPVTVHYVKEGDRMLANRVVVNRTVTTTRRALTEDEREELKEQREEQRERLKEAREEERERRKELREELEDD